MSVWWQLVSSFAPPQIYFFSLQLLTAYYATVLFLGMLIFSSSLFDAIISLLKIPSYFTSWNVQVSMMFIYITSTCISTEKLLWFEFICRITSGSLGKREMLWRQKFVSACLNNFSMFSQTWTTWTNYRHTAFSSCYSYQHSFGIFLPRL